MYNSDGKARQFLKRFATGFLLLAAVAVTLTWAIDPLGVLHPFGGGRLCAPGIKSGEAREAKFISAVANRPHDVLIGSSRVEEGFDSASADRLLKGRAVNMSFGGALLDEVDRSLREVAIRTSVKRVWISLEFGAFAKAPFNERPLTFPGDSPMPLFAWREGLFSPVALRTAAVTLLRPDRCRSPPLDQYGFNRSVGVGKWERRDRAMELLSDKWQAQKESRERSYSGRLQQLRQLTRWTRSRDIELILFLGPVSDSYHRTLEGAGLAGVYRQWREDVSSIAREEGAVFIEADTRAFLDAVAVRCPTASTREQCLFYDPVHFRPPVGAAILVAGTRPNPSIAPEVAGSQVSRGSIGKIP